MLKMRQFRSLRGDTAGFWEENWSDADLEESRRFPEVDPLRPLFEMYAPAGTRMLEGGCGLGQYVAAYASSGRWVVGLDFARDTLARLRRAGPGLMLCAGNVAALPFRSGAFDVYYSGGVVEHFEGGAEPALREAWRILRPGGTLLVSVPYFSPLRHLLLLLGRRGWRKVPRTTVDEEDGTVGRFWQYAFTQSEFTRILSDLGFDVVKRQGYSILWGLYDIPLVEAMVERFRQAASRGVRGAHCTVAHPAPAREPSAYRSSPSERMVHLSLMKRLVVSEDASVPGAGWIIRALRATTANMMMYVCIRPAADGVS